MDSVTTKIALPQAFDEFLTSDVLPCLVEGCDWKGHHLSMHMNQTHGVTAENFKKLAGFNLGSGIVSAPLHQHYCERDHVGIATDNSRFPQFTTGMQTKRKLSIGLWRERTLGENSRT